MLSCFTFRNLYSKIYFFKYETLLLPFLKKKKIYYYYFLHLWLMVCCDWEILRQYFRNQTPVLVIFSKCIRRRWSKNTLGRRRKRSVIDAMICCVLISASQAHPLHTPTPPRCRNLKSDWSDSRCWFILKENGSDSSAAANPGVIRYERSTVSIVTAHSHVLAHRTVYVTLD